MDAALNSIGVVVFLFLIFNLWRLTDERGFKRGILDDLERKIRRAREYDDWKKGAPERAALAAAAQAGSAAFRDHIAKRLAEIDAQHAQGKKGAADSTNEAR